MHKMEASVKKCGGNEKHFDSGKYYKREASVK